MHDAQEANNLIVLNATGNLAGLLGIAEQLRIGNVAKALEGLESTIDCQLFLISRELSNADPRKRSTVISVLRLVSTYRRQHPRTIDYSCYPKEVTSSEVDDTARQAGEILRKYADPA